MKPILACVVLVAVFAKLQARPSADSPINYEEGLKKSAEYLADLTKKLEESTGIHSEFDKEKYIKAGKALLEKLQEAQTKLKEAYESNFKNFPAAEDLKKKIEEVQKQITESLKGLNSPDVQKSTEKLRDTVLTSSKKITESLNEVAQKLGVAPPPAIQKSLQEIHEETLFYHGNSSETMDKHLVGKFSSEDRLASLPCSCEKSNKDISLKYKNPPLKGLRNSLMTERNSFPNPRLTNMDARERKERLDERMARFMQLMTFFGHVDNFLTQKTSGFLKVMGKAVGADDYEEDYEPRYRSVKRVPPRIKTIISS
ncbi:hypothetical protein V9T40_009708 [Parthenolecanium corni]|uniref:Uncharacterized protein n=1 Tax=Parthenolecanium corni TaxID=536013 RepID=A0AAN9Y922_9HEMI